MTTLERDVAQPKYVDLAGYRMAYREWGDATATHAVVLIHGITSSSLSWIRVAPRLAERARVIAVDLKGHGDSDRPPTGYRLLDQANEVAALCAALGLQTVSLMGHSWGGGIALLLAARHLLEPRRLLLEDPAIGQRTITPEQEPLLQRMVQMYVSSVGLSREAAEAQFGANLASGWTEQDVAGKVDAAVKGSRDAVSAVFAENADWDLVDEFAAVQCPTLLVRAEVALGGLVNPAAVAVAQANPHIRVVTIAGADHNIHRVTFEAFMAEAEPFLNG